MQVVRMVELALERKALNEGDVHHAADKDSARSYALRQTRLDFVASTLSLELFDKAGGDSVADQVQLMRQVSAPRQLGASLPPVKGATSASDSQQDKVAASKKKGTNVKLSAVHQPESPAFDTPSSDNQGYKTVAGASAALALAKQGASLVDIAH